MKFLLGEKIEMSQLFNEKGELVPVTLVKVNSSIVSQVKENKEQGDIFVEIGFGSIKSTLTKPLAGHLKPILSFWQGKAPHYMRGFRCRSGENFKVGDILNADIFKEGEKIDVRGFSKGRGFAGVVKRWDFRGHPSSHGHEDQERMPGSIGSKRIGGVAKGKRMGGHLGDEKIYIKNLEVAKVDKEKGILYIKGALPGARGSYVELISYKGKIEGKLNNFLENTGNKVEEVVNK